MHLYEVYEHRNHPPIAVKIGFSWWAFIAPTAWAAAKGLGRTTLLLVLASTLLFDLLDLSTRFITDPVVMMPLLLVSHAAFGLRPGLYGNRWHARTLTEEGWTRRCRILADSRRQALRAFRSGRFEPATELLLAGNSALAD